MRSNMLRSSAQAESLFENIDPLAPHQLQGRYQVRFVGNPGRLRCLDGTILTLVFTGVRYYTLEHAS
jgi:hypothetical protein